MHAPCRGVSAKGDRHAGLGGDACDPGRGAAVRHTNAHDWGRDREGRGDTDTQNGRPFPGSVLAGD